MALELIPIKKENPRSSLMGEIEFNSEICKQVIEATWNNYKRSGYQEPWIAYFGKQDKRVVGTGAFKSPPLNGEVEVAYFTFPEFEGRGIATLMLSNLLCIAKAQSAGTKIVANTAPEESSSTQVLKKCGFEKIGFGQDEEIGETWKWVLIK